jgi:hypothetical protein
MCFDLIKESLVDKFAWFVYRLFILFFIFNYLRFAHKFGFISEDDDQIDDDPIGYANFQYAQQQEIPDNRKNQSTESPPAYEYATTDGQWLKGIRDKV